MGKSGRHFDFPEESLGADFGGDLRPKDLEGDPALMAKVPGQEHQRHAPFTQLALERIAAGETGIEAFLELRHGIGKMLRRRARG